MTMPTAWLPDRAVIAVSGADRVSFLQGLVSNDVAQAEPGHAVWAGFLTPQGRYLSDFFIVAEPERILLDVARGQAEMLASRLSRFRLRADVQLSVTDLGVEAGWGDAAMPEGAFADPRLAEAGWRLCAPPPATPDEDDARAYDSHRLKLGLPDAVDYEPEKTLLLEANFDWLNGVSWKKGCYMGQELTARTHYRGLVKKRLVPVHADTVLPGFNSPITVDGKEVGTLRSAQGQIGLAFLRREAWDKPLLCDDVALQARLPDWFKEETP
ncbi:CAF17-like 4Fe-4S cluster assembly/insertion protein YgfZ [Kozakia baliensis]|nr:folate-binding protein YgfZ [Kozakia baliensis]GEL63321.1 glycine cleavage system protein T [Kozakia baliensis]